jgi:hypothetical protein
MVFLFFGFLFLGFRRTSASFLSGTALRKSS